MVSRPHYFPLTLSPTLSSRTVRADWRVIPSHTKDEGLVQQATVARLPVGVKWMYVDNHPLRQAGWQLGRQ